MKEKQSKKEDSVLGLVEIVKSCPKCHSLNVTSDPNIPSLYRCNRCGEVFSD
jgi:hypothetical protein